jgi:hypothetical protein
VSFAYIFVNYASILFQHQYTLLPNMSKKSAALEAKFESGGGGGGGGSGDDNYDDDDDGDDGSNNGNGSESNQQSTNEWQQK